MANKARSIPITIAPVSPIKISDGSQLKTKKEISPPIIAKQNKEKTKSPIRKNQMPKASNATNPMLPASPSSPSIKLKEFVIRITTKPVKKYPKTMGIW